MGVHETKTFKSGNSVALRLPKALAIPAGKRMVVERRGDVLTVRPAREPEQVRQELRKLIDDLAAIGAPADGVQEREPIEFPERPGL